MVKPNQNAKNYGFNKYLMESKRLIHYETKTRPIWYNSYDKCNIYHIKYKPKLY